MATSTEKRQKVGLFQRFFHLSMSIFPRFPTFPAFSNFYSRMNPLATAAARGAAPLEAEEAEFETSNSVKVSALCVCAAAGLVRRRPGCAGRRVAWTPMVPPGAKSSDHASCAAGRPRGRCRGRRGTLMYCLRVAARSSPPAAPRATPGAVRPARTGVCACVCACVCRR
jgi:hypothetical protein